MYRPLGPVAPLGEESVLERISGPSLAVPHKVIDRLMEYRRSRPYDPILSQIVIDLEIALANPAALKEASSHAD